MSEEYRIAEMFNNFQPAVEFVVMQKQCGEWAIHRGSKGSRRDCENFIRRRTIRLVTPAADRRTG